MMMEGMQAFRTEQQDLVDEKMRLFVEELNRERDNRSNLRTNVAFPLARLSPTASFSLAASDLAFTSMQLRSSYLEAASAYQQEFAAFMRSKNVDYGGEVYVRHGAPVVVEEPELIDTSELPLFAYVQPPVSEAIAASAPDLGILFMFNTFFFAGAFVKFNRYDVR
jgi:hypothetical protein